MSTVLYGNQFQVAAGVEALQRPKEYFEQALQRFGLDRTKLRGKLEVRTSLRLERSVVEACAGTAQMLSSVNLDQYKSWVGISDREFASETFAPMLGTPARSPEEMDRAILAGQHAVLDELRRANGLYLVGDSSKVRAYRRVIEKHLAPLPAQLYVLDSIEISPGAVLDITGVPVALIVRSLRIHTGGSLRLLTMARIEVEQLSSGAA